MMKSPSALKILRSFIYLLFVGIGVYTVIFSVPIALAGISYQEESSDPTPTSEAVEVPTPQPGVPVRFNGEVLFFVRVGREGISVVERALLIERRINDLARNPFIQDVDITLAESTQGIELIAGDQSLFTVTEEDAQAIGMDQNEAAQKAAELIQAAINDAREKETLIARLSRIIQITIVVVGLILAYFVIHRIYRKIIYQIDKLPTEGSEKGVVYRTRYYRSGVWRRWAKTSAYLLKWFLFILILLIGTPYILKLFPATIFLGAQITVLLSKPLQIAWSWIFENTGNFISIAMISMVFYILIRITRATFQEIGEGNIQIKGFDPEWAAFTNRIISFLLITAAVIIAFPYIPGSESPAFRAITVFLGALFTLSSTSAVTNIVAGVIQTYTGAFRAGDIVRIGDVTGKVIAKQLITTRVLTFKNEEVSIPNGNVLSTNVINYSCLARLNELVLYTTVTIGYDVPWQKVHELLIAAAQSTSAVMVEPPPYVLQTSLNDFHISYQLNCYTNQPERMYVTYSELHSNIQDQFNAAGLEIMSPAFMAFRDGNESTISGTKAQRDNPDGLFHK